MLLACYIFFALSHGATGDGRKVIFYLHFLKDSEDSNKLLMIKSSKIFLVL